MVYPRGDWRTLPRWGRAFLNETAFRLHAGAKWATWWSTAATMGNGDSIWVQLVLVGYHNAVPVRGVGWTWRTARRLLGRGGRLGTIVAGCCGTWRRWCIQSTGHC